MPHNVTQRQVIAFTSADVGKAAVAGDAEVTLDFGVVMSSTPAALKRKKFRLVNVDFIRATGASATNYQPRISDVSGAASGAWAVKYEATATAPGTRITTTGLDVYLYTDTGGKLYLTLAGDAADTFDYSVWFEVLG